MARIEPLAIASLDPEKQAEFYKKVFGFEEVRRLDNPRARGVVLTDGYLNISVLQFHQDQIDHGLEFTGLHHFDVYVEDLEGTAQRCLEAGCMPYDELPLFPDLPTVAASGLPGTRRRRTSACSPRPPLRRRWSSG